MSVKFQVGAKVYAAPADATMVGRDSTGVPVVLTEAGVGPMVLVGSVAADPCLDEDGGCP